MRILHVSDTHGQFDPLSTDGDVVVHSGDLMPNRTFGIAQVEHAFQRYWVEDNAKRIRDWVGSRPFLLTLGNHDFIDPTQYLRDVGLDARLLHDGVELGGVRFCGFPWTPTFYDWAWMCGPVEMAERLRPAVDLMNRGDVDVFVSHGPMYGVLDRNRDGTRCGCKVLRETMQTVDVPPKLLLHGHIHEAAGWLGWSNGMTVSNAARTQRVLDIA